MKNGFTVAMVALIVYGTIPAESFATGISVDAGLTPPEGRWITRAQMRYMPSGTDDSMGGNEMTMYGFPVMVAYGARNYLMVMARQTIMRRDMTMMDMSSSETGLSDLFLLAKYKAYRLNTPDYTIGISPTLGISIPTGDEMFTSDSWDLNVGLYLSGRHSGWGTDLNIAYRWFDFTGGSDNIAQPGDEFSIDGAVAYQHGISSDIAIAPVLEISYK